MDPTAPADEPPRRHTILVVDDEEDIVQSLRTMIEDAADVDVVCASSGPEALRVLEGRPVDLIISDYKMPGMDGLQLLHHARAIAPAAQRILITAYPDLDLALRAINEEAVRNVIVKPFDPSMVMDNVFAVLLNLRAEELKARSLARALEALHRERV